MDKYQIYVYQTLIIKSFFINFKENFLNKNDAEKNFRKEKLKFWKMMPKNRKINIILQNWILYS